MCGGCIEILYVGKVSVGCGGVKEGLPGGLVCMFG